MKRNQRTHNRSLATLPAMFASAFSFAVRAFVVACRGSQQVFGIKALRLAGAVALGGCLLTGVPLAAQVTPLPTWTWTHQTPATSPPARSAATVAYDAATGQVVLFGGNNGSAALGDTWTWDGTNWTQQSPAISPPARHLAAMAYDASAGQLVLFGG